MFTPTIHPLKITNHRRGLFVFLPGDTKFSVAVHQLFKPLLFFT